MDRGHTLLLLQSECCGFEATGRQTDRQIEAFTLVKHNLFSGVGIVPQGDSQIMGK